MTYNELEQERALTELPLEERTETVRYWMTLAQRNGESARLWRHYVDYDLLALIREQVGQPLEVESRPEIQNEVLSDFMPFLLFVVGLFLGYFAYWFSF